MAVRDDALCGTGFQPVAAHRLEACATRIAHGHLGPAVVQSGFTDGWRPLPRGGTGRLSPAYGIQMSPPARPEAATGHWRKGRPWRRDTTTNGYDTEGRDANPTHVSGPQSRPGRPRRAAVPGRRRAA